MYARAMQVYSYVCSAYGGQIPVRGSYRHPPPLAHGCWDLNFGPCKSSMYSCLLSHLSTSHSRFFSPQITITLLSRLLSNQAPCSYKTLPIFILPKPGSHQHIQDSRILNILDSSHTWNHSALFHFVSSLFHSACFLQGHPDCGNCRFSWHM